MPQVNEAPRTFFQDNRSIGDHCFLNKETICPQPKDIEPAEHQIQGHEVHPLSTSGNDGDAQDVPQEATTEEQIVESIQDQQEGTLN